MKRNGSSRKARIVLVDDHPLVREALAQRISRHADLEVCAEAADAAEALEAINRTRPDLVVVDLSLKSGDGLELIKRIRLLNTGIRMLVCSMYDEALYAERSLRAGALGYVSKQEQPQRMIEAIRTVLAGKLFLSPELGERLARRALGSRQAEPASVTDTLSDRELEVFTQIGKGMTTGQIAAAMHVSVKTVETYRERMKTKLGVATGAELVRRAVQWVLQQS